MSEVLSFYDRERYFNCVGIDSNHSLQYTARQGVNSVEILLTIHVTNKCLKGWYEFKEQKAFPELKFIDIANVLIGEKFGILLPRDCERIENRLASFKSQFVAKKCRDYVTFGNKVRKIAIRKGEVVRVRVYTENFSLRKVQAFDSRDNT